MAFCFAGCFAKRCPRWLLHAVGRNALPVVEIEQHGRALRRSFQQIAELAEHVRTNRIALIRGRQNPIRALVHVHVEVVEPEIGHLLFELPVAVNRAIQLGFVQIVGQHLLGRVVGHQLAALHGIGGSQHLLPHRLLQGIATLALLALHIGLALVVTLSILSRAQALDLHLRSLPSLRIGGKRQGPVHHRPYQLRRRIVGRDLFRAHVQRLQRLQPLGELRIFCNALGVKLLVDPLLQAHFPHCLDVAGARAEGQAIECVEDLLVFAERLTELAVVGAAVGSHSRHQQDRNSKLLHGVWVSTTNNAGTRQKLYADREGLNLRNT